MKRNWLSVMVLLLAVASAVGCSSDSESGGSASFASCNAYCDATVAASCPDATECKADNCEGLDKVTGACDATMKTYYDCMKAQSNVCSDGAGCTFDLTKCS
jgi:hypothetical protein